MRSCIFSLLINSFLSFMNFHNLENNVYIYIEIKEILEVLIRES